MRALLEQILIEQEKKVAVQKAALKLIIAIEQGQSKEIVYEYCDHLLKLIGIDPNEKRDRV